MVFPILVLQVRISNRTNILLPEKFLNHMEQKMNFQPIFLYVNYLSSVSFVALVFSFVN